MGHYLPHNVFSSAFFIFRNTIKKYYEMDSVLFFNIQEIPRFVYREITINLKDENNQINEEI